MKISFHVVRGRQAPTLIHIDAPDVNQARQEVSRQGWTILSFDQTEASAKPHGEAPKHLSVLIEQIHSLLLAGLSIVEVLDTLARNPNTPWRSVLLQLIKSLREGKTLSQAMAQQPVFPALLNALVQSAELTSDLPAALHRYLEHDRRIKQIRQQLTSVALYPIVLTTVGSAVVFFLLLYVMPRFARIFETMGNLPWSATLMVSWAQLLKNHGWMLGMGFAGLVGALFFFFAIPAYRSRLLTALLAIPAIANRLRVYYLARWYRTTSMLVTGGITLPEAIALANTVLPGGLRPQGELVEASMREGQSPSSAYQIAGMATAVADQLIRAGERSGDMGPMLARAANFHEAEVTQALDNAMRIVEPLVMTFVGVGVGILVILMYLPIFELASAIQ